MRQRRSILSQLLGLALFPLTLIAAASNGRAEEHGWTQADFVEARLVSAVNATGQLETIPVALELR